jgi:threonine/homoserine/homoserine lactone efflux protein
MDPLLPPLAKGLVVGFSIAAPVGPIGVLCIRRSLAQGAAMGLATGLGAATADAMYGCVAAFGLTAVSSALIRLNFWLSLLGGLFLCWLGAATFGAAPAQESQAAGARSKFAAWSSTVGLTLSNPTTILSFAAIFAGFGLGVYASWDAAAAMVLGVFAGSALWWLILSSTAAALRARLTPAGMRWVNRSSGLIILSFGIIALGRAILA